LDASESITVNPRRSKINMEMGAEFEMRWGENKKGNRIGMKDLNRKVDKVSR